MCPLEVVSRCASRRNLGGAGASLDRQGRVGVTTCDRCGSSKHNIKSQVALSSRVKIDSWHSITSLFYAIYL